MASKLASHFTSRRRLVRSTFGTGHCCEAIVTQAGWWWGPHVGGGSGPWAALQGRVVVGRMSIPVGLYCQWLFQPETKLPVPTLLCTLHFYTFFGVFGFETVQYVAIFKIFYIVVFFNEILFEIRNWYLKRLLVNPHPTLAVHRDIFVDLTLFNVHDI